jgi:DNA modification methylase
MNERERYQKFLEMKVVVAQQSGVAVGAVNPILKPHQRVIVEWMATGGRRACFAAFGLGKTMIQLETLRLVLERSGGRGLIVAPLGVRQEFKRDAEMLGIPIRFIRRTEEADQLSLEWEEQKTIGIFVTNYESVRDGKLDATAFTVASLDEASVLRSFGGTKTFREFMRIFETVKYRFVATATPSPNEFIELLSYAAFLGIMDVGQAKTRFFKRDSVHADRLTLHGHKTREFWLWVASWAIFLQRPSDIGFDDTGYDLPPIDVRWHEVPSTHSNAGSERDGQLRLFQDSAIGVSNAAREKRDSLPARIGKLMELIHEQTREGIGTNDAPTPNESIQRLPEDVSTSVLPPAQEKSRGLQEFNGPAGLHDCLLGSEQSSSNEEAERKGEKSYLRNNTRRVQLAPDDTGLGMCDLSEVTDEACDRSRSYDGRSERTTLQTVQCGNRDAGRQSISVAESGGLSDQIVVWCDLNEEQTSIERALSRAGISFSSLYGSQTIEERELLLDDWRSKKTKVFLTKPVMYGAGINLQQCHKMCFIGITFKFSDTIQAIHRIYRFLQNHPVRIDLIYSESERGVRQTLQRKWDQHKELVEEMSKIIREFGLSHASLASKMTRSIDFDRVEVNGEGYRLINSDAVEECRALDNNSIDFVLTSIPFSTQYEYTPSYRDLGHTNDNAHFFEHLDFVTTELYRTLKPGRVAAIHVKDRIVPGGLTGLGFQTVSPFSDDTVRHFIKHGFAFLARKTIVTDVVRENNQTYRLGWTEQCKDGSRMGAGMPEYMLLFRKPPSDRSNGYADEPVVKSKDEYSKARWQIDAHGFTRSNGNRPILPEELMTLEHNAIFKLFRKYGLEEVYDYEYHVKLGEALEEAKRLPVTFMLLQPPSWHPDVWTDIARMRTLNMSQAQKGKEFHLCPMQFDIANRMIRQFTQPGDTVLDPFGGLMTVPYCAIQMGRRGIGIELNPNYFKDGVMYCEAASRKKETPTLFDLVEISEAPDSEETLCSQA